MFQEISGFEAAHEVLAESESPRGRTVSASRIAAAKRAFSTRRAALEQRLRLIERAIPRAGDLVLARVTQLGQHQRLELPTGRRAQLYEGDEIIVAYGARYAPDQFEAIVPGDLGPCDLVAGGGIAGKAISRHARIKRATRIEPVGLLADAAGEVLNLDRFALPPREVSRSRPRVIAVAGTSMNAGKTTCAAGLVHGLSRAGLRLAAVKVTGTGSGGDLWSMLDAGAGRVLDFTDLGHASTAGLPLAALETTALSLIAHAIEDGPDVVVVEIADGLLQSDTAALLRSPRFRQAVDGLLFAAGDALGAVAGRDWLQREGWPVIGLSGLVSASPLASREAAAALDCEVLTLDQLRDPALAPKLCFAAEPMLQAYRIAV